jgi:hypothetical protein
LKPWLRATLKEIHPIFSAHACFCLDGCNLTGHDKWIDGLWPFFDKEINTKDAHGQKKKDAHG